MNNLLDALADGILPAQQIQNKYRQTNQLMSHLYHNISNCLQTFELQGKNHLLKLLLLLESQRHLSIHNHLNQIYPLNIDLQFAIYLLAI